MIDLKVKIGNLNLKNPVILASGCCGYGLEMEDFFSLEEVGGIVLKGLSLKERQGNLPPRICETPSGMINSIGLQNVGIEKFINEKLPQLKKKKGVFIANIFGETEEEYLKLSEIINEIDIIPAIELNCSCPNVQKGGIHFGTEPEILKDLVFKIRKIYKKDLWVKLSPNVTSILPLAKAAIDAGADALTCANTYKAMAIDVDTGMVKIRNIFGGLSGPAIRPLTLRLVYEINKNFKVPIIASGGVENYRDGLEYILAGASAFQIGTILFKNPKAPMEIINGLKKYLKEKKINSIKDLIGEVKTYE
ncbi:MAG: dihydroorotate dehydrogenase [Thermoanaerobaculia bacterium]